MINTIKINNPFIWYTSPIHIAEFYQPKGVVYIVI